MLACPWKCKSDGGELWIQMIFLIHLIHLIQMKKFEE
jgi:hypothetical protein